MVSDWKNETMATDANLRGYAIKASFGVPRHSLPILVFFKVWMIKNRVVQLLSCVNLRHWTSKLVLKRYFGSFFYLSSPFCFSSELPRDLRWIINRLPQSWIQRLQISTNEAFSFSPLCFDGFSPSPVVPTPTALRRLVAFHGSGESCHLNFATI